MEDKPDPVGEIECKKEVDDSELLLESKKLEILVVEIDSIIEEEGVLIWE